MTSTNWLDLIKDAATAGPAATREPLPDGNYELKVLEAKSGTTGNGKPKYTLKTEVQVGPHAGRFLWTDLIVSDDNPKAMAFFFRKMKAIGLTEEFFSQQPSDDQIVSALNGRSFRGKVTTRVWNDQPRNEISEFHPATASAGVPGFGGTPQAAPAPQAAFQAPAPQPQAAPAPAPAPAPQAAPETPWNTAPAPAPAPQTAPVFPGNSPF